MPEEARALIQNYLAAAIRKIKIAEFLCTELGKAVEAHLDPDTNGFPHIAVQAHFEGVVTATMAAINKMCESLQVNLEKQAKISRSDKLKIIRGFTPCCKEWLDESFQNDLIEVRNALVHRSYEKTHHPSGWKVEKPLRSSYTGSRDLLEYAKAASKYAQDMLPTIKELEPILLELSA